MDRSRADLTGECFPPYHSFCKPNSELRFGLGSMTTLDRTQRGNGVTQNEVFMLKEMTNSIAGETAWTATMVTRRPDIGRALAQPQASPVPLRAANLS
jgi:hypothetical protein